jgi:hypothetical protein
MVTIGCLLARIACTASIQENYRFVTLPTKSVGSREVVVPEIVECKREEHPH